MENQVFYTVLSGTLVFVLGQILQKFVLEPIQEYKKTIGKIDNQLKFYCNVLINAVSNEEQIVKLTDIVRALSCDLESIYKQIPLSGLFSKIRVLETKSDVAKAAKLLISISNSGGRSDTRALRCDDEIEKVRKLLKIESLN